MIESPIQYYDIKDQVIAYTVGDQPAGQKSYDVFIPLLEPFLAKNKKIETVPIEYNGFLNKGNKPKYNKIMKIKHTFNIPVLENAKIKTVTKGNEEVVLDNTKLICLCMNRDINSIYIQTSVDK